MKRRIITVTLLFLLTLLTTGCSTQLETIFMPFPDSTSVEETIPENPSVLPEETSPTPQKPLELPPEILEETSEATELPPDTVPVTPDAPQLGDSVEEPMDTPPADPLLEEPPKESEVTPAPTPQPTTGLPILMYHHVVPDGTACNDMTVTVSKLRQDFEYLLSKGYTPILPRDLAAGKAVPEKAVMITFDDGYTSNYRLLYPLLQEYGLKVLISPIVTMPDIPANNFCSWDMYREMVSSGLVEVGSHTYQLHNLDGRDGNFTPGGVNGIQRLPEESDAAFQTRVLDDIQKSLDRLETELGVPVTCFAYPFGVAEADAQPLINSLFPVTLMTRPATADPSSGLHSLPRWTITMKTDLSTICK